MSVTNRVIEGRLGVGGIVPPFDSLIFMFDGEYPSTDPVVHLLTPYVGKRIRMTISVIEPEAEQPAEPMGM